MTLEEILALRQSDPVRFDVLTAGVVGFAGCDNCGGMSGCLCKAAGIGSGLPRYHADPAADLEANRAACGWEVGRRRYFDHLHEILNRRWRDARPREVEHYQSVTGERCFDLTLMRWYTVGDYAAAALATVMEGEA